MKHKLHQFCHASLLLFIKIFTKCYIHDWIHPFNLKVGSYFDFKSAFLILFNFFCYSGLTMFFSFCCIVKWLSHTYIHTILTLSSIMFCPKEIGYSSLCRTLLLIHSKCNSLHVVTLNSQSIPLLSPPPSPWQICLL